MTAITWRRVILVVVFAAGSFEAGNTNAWSQSNLPQQAGIWWQRAGSTTMSASHEQRLTERMRRITGYCELHFAPDGRLSTGAGSTLRGGAETARSILQQALHSGVIFFIEDHSGSEAVHFGQLEPFWLRVTEPPNDLEINRVRLDFKDFREMEAPRVVRDTFDEGFTLLHELLHGLGYEDAFDQYQVGPCEQIVNQVRGELGLAFREQYLADAVPVTEQYTTLRLRFRSKSSRPGGKSKSHFLFFLVRDNLQSINALAYAARMTRARTKANPDKRIAVKASLAPPAAPEPAVTSPRE